MKQNPNFILSKIADVPYLLPVGQAIADHKRGLKTNTTGVYLWNLLAEEHSLEEVLSLSAAHYGISANELPEFEQEITEFVRMLCSNGILTESTKVSDTSFVFRRIETSRAAELQKSSDVPAKPQTYLLSIGGITLKLVCPEEAFPPEFADFVINDDAANVPKAWQEIILHPTIPSEALAGDVLLHNYELNILEQEHGYLLHFPTAKRHLEIHLDKTGSTAHCYSSPPYNADFRYDFFHAIRLSYLYLAKQHGMVALHSASLLYRDKLWLFSGHSGTGKSTHTNLWKELYGTPVINGDLNLLALENGQPAVHGIPWCGTSGICDTKTYPLGGIILMKQAKENSIEHLTPDAKRLLVSQRLISPAWTKELWSGNVELVDTMAEQLLICRLHCTKEKEAAEVMKKEIDTTLN